MEASEFVTLPRLRNLPLLVPIEKAKKTEKNRQKNRSGVLKIILNILKNPALKNIRKVNKSKIKFSNPDIIISGFRASQIKGRNSPATTVRGALSKVPPKVPSNPPIS